MKIIKKQVLRGPNQWSNYRNRLIQVQLDLEEMEQFPTNKIEGFLERFTGTFPSMITHECSEGTAGGFFERLRRGTWLGHVMEHVALELQTMAGMDCGFGRTRESSVKGIYTIVFTYVIEEAGLYSFDAAFKLVSALAHGEDCDVAAEVTVVKNLALKFGLGPSTKSIVDEAERRGIPWSRMGTNSKIRLGYGTAQKQFQATITCTTSEIAVRLAGNKDATKKILASHYVPVAKGDCCTTIDELQSIIERIGFPLVLKPLDGNQGKGATINVVDYDAAVAAFDYAKTYSSIVLVEHFISGFDYRFLVVDGRFIAAAKRIPALIVGDGKLTIDRLLLNLNSQEGRGNGHESSLTKIVADQDLFTQLSKYGYTLNSIPKRGEVLNLKSTCNLSTGGTAEDVTDSVHSENIFLAERVAKIIGLDVCGIDIVTTSVAEPLSTNGGVVLEVNAAPGFRMHLNPSVGQPRNVAKAVVAMLYPEGSSSKIPLFAVTGTNGKTTTTRLLAHIGKLAGYTVGYTTTDGIYVNGYKIKSGDCSGPSSGSIVLSDPTVDFAVLETARGGLLRNGLCFDTCDVGIVTNIAEDHLGLNEIHTLEQLTNVKAVIPRSVHKDGWAILNADDTNCLKIAAELTCKVGYFTMDIENATIRKLLSDDLLVAYVENGVVTISYEGVNYPIEHVNNIPLSNGGAAKFMIANVLAALAAAFSYGLDIELIRKALCSFEACYEMTPGRLNLFKFKNYNVLVDYAHNPHGLLALKDYLRTMPSSRTIGIIAGIGDRRDEDTILLAKIAASMFDHIIVRQEHSLRGKNIEDINALVAKGISSAARAVTYEFIPDETEAIQHALKIVKSGELLVALSDDYETVIRIINEHLLIERTVASFSEIPTSS